MAQIYPFRGLRYNKEKVGDISQVVSPPYDVISPADEAALLARSPYNAVHIDLPRITDPEANAVRYAEAGQRFRQWITSGVLQAEKADAIYVYRQTYTVPCTGESRQLVGFLAALELVGLDKGVVLPHEHTFAKPKADRLNLMRATAANLSSVYGFYSDPAQEVEAAFAPLLAKAPDVSAKDDNGELHQVWVATGPEVAVARRVLANRAVFIADGHHRYETALDYQRERAAAASDPSASWNTVMMMLVNLDAGGLTILPTHRVLHGIPAPDPAALRKALEPLFIVQEEQVANAAAAASRTTGLRPGEFAAYVAPGKLWLISRRNTEAIVQAIPEERSRAWKELDVAILHSLVLEGAMRLSRTSLDRQENMYYTRDAEEACQAVDNASAVMAFLLPSPSVSAVKDVALAGDVMPHKSTYFYPKLLTGLVFADLNTKLPVND